MLRYALYGIAAAMLIALAAVATIASGGRYVAAIPSPNVPVETPNAISKLEDHAPTTMDGSRSLTRRGGQAIAAMISHRSGSRSSYGVICLMYHRFASPDDYARMSGDDRLYTIPIDRFEQQLADLRRLRFTPLTAAQAVAFARQESVLPGPTVLITIDDGSRSVLTLAAPLLRAYGMRATLFITTDPTAYVFDPAKSDEGRLTDDEIRGLDPELFDVQAHGVTHRPLRSLPDDALRHELDEARRVLEPLTGRPVRELSVPGNWYDDRVLEFACRSGYEAVFVSDKGIIRPGGDVPRMPRYMVQGYKSRTGFRKMLSAAFTDAAGHELTHASAARRNTAVGKP